jgi:hypothetical protein
MQNIVIAIISILSIMIILYVIGRMLIIVSDIMHIYSNCNIPPTPKQIKEAVRTRRQSRIDYVMIAAIALALGVLAVSALYLIGAMILKLV